MVSYSSSPGIEGDLDKNGFALTLAGECPLCGAGRLEDGAPAPRECLRRGWVPAPLWSSDP